MISLLLALTAGPAIQEERLTVPCEMTPTGWVCRYQMPAVTIQGVPQATIVVPGPSVPATTVSTPTPEISTAEADRRARLIARCADASWLTLCLPGDRREARILQDAAIARLALRGEVTCLLSENRCDDAVRAALAGGDLGLAREAREFCQPAAGVPAAPQAENAEAVPAPRS